MQVLKRKLLSPINSQKLNVCIEFLFPAAGNNIIPFFTLFTWFSIYDVYPDVAHYWRPYNNFSGMLWLSYVTDNPDLCVAILSIRFPFTFQSFNFPFQPLLHIVFTVPQSMSLYCSHKIVIKSFFNRTFVSIDILIY